MTQPMIHRWLLFCIALTAANGCALTPPSENGVLLYQQGNLQGAFRELSPLARNGDANSQYYSAKILLMRAPTPSLQDQQQAGDWAISAAQKGSTGALGMSFVLAMSPTQFARFIDATLPLPLGYARIDKLDSVKGSARDRALFEIDAETRRLAEKVAAGPVSLPTLAAMATTAHDLKDYRALNGKAIISDAQLLSVDMALAKLDDKYAQARLGNRFAYGLGVKQNLETALSWRLKAAKDTPPQRSCVYQAPVGNASGSTYCYDSSPAAEGVPQAKLEVCKAYAYGLGVSENTDKAREWCREAGASAAQAAEAARILQDIAK